MKPTESLWNQTCPRNNTTTPADFHQKAFGVIVIGAGLAGILTAFFLKEKGVSCLVLEAEKTAGGNTQNTTGKITAQHGMIYHRLIQEQGEEKAREYASLNQKAVASYESLIDKKKINCDFQRVSSFLFTNLEKNLPKLKEEERAARKLGLHAVLTDTASLPFPCKGALCLPDQAQFHPLRFIRALAKELLVLENTRAESVYEKTETGDPGFPPPSAGRSGPGRYCVSTNQGEFWGEKIVFACQYPFLNIPGYYFLKMHQDRSYVLTLKKKDASAIAPDLYYSIDPDGHSLRSYNDYLLLEGEGHRTGENRKGGKYRKLRRYARILFPDCPETACWSAQDCMTPDGIPYIGLYSESTPHWYIATGFNKWGMTSSMVAAMLLSDLITGTSRPDGEIFSPQRFFFSPAAKTVAMDGFRTVRALAAEVLSPPQKSMEALSPGHGGIVDWDGEKAAVYKDAFGNVYGVSPRCPHLGGQLEWNPDEKSWDCPCHGSRFTYMGKRLDNPAQYPLKTCGSLLTDPGEKKEKKY